MAVKLVTDSPNGTLGDVVEYEVAEDATPLNIDDSDGGVGQIQVATRAHVKGPVKDRSVAVIGSTVTLTDSSSIEHTAVKGYGTVAGQITDAPIVGERINITAETIRARFRADRVAKPFYGSFIPAATATNIRKNNATNPEFETNTTNVVASNTGTGTFTITRPADGGYRGTYYASAVYGGANATTVGAGVHFAFPVPLAATTYTASAFYRISRATTVPEGTSIQRVQFILRYYNAAVVQVGSDVRYLQTVTTNNWSRLSIAGDAPAGAVSGRVYIISASGTGYAAWKIGDSIDLDAVLVEEGGLGEPFAGDTPTEIVTYEDGVVITRTYAWTGTPHASSSTETTAITTPDAGYDATQGNYFRYLCELVGISNPEVDPEFDRKPVAYPGWEGDVWTQVKKFCAAIGGEVAVVNDTVALRIPRTIDVPLESVGNFVVRTQQTMTSQFVEVVNYNSYWGVDELVAAPTTAYQVDVGETMFAELTVPHFIDAPNSPSPVLQVDQNYAVGGGQYQVLDSQDTVVDPDWWTSANASVVVRSVYGDPNKLTLIVRGPDLNANGYVGPYKLARTYGDDALPALYITGSGVFINKESVQIRTGVSAEQTSTEVSPVIDNEFISNASLAYTKGLDAACLAAGPIVTINGTMGYDVTASGQSFGTLIGGRIRVADNIFRITSVSYGLEGISFSGKADMVMSDLTDLFSYTFAEFNAGRGSITFTQFNTAEAGKTFAVFNAAQPSPTFDSLNLVYDGATFNTHAIFPNTNEVYVAEQTI